jgi:hypothetical protein
VSQKKSQGDSGVERVVDIADKASIPSPRVGEHCLIFAFGIQPAVDFFGRLIVQSATDASKSAAPKSKKCEPFSSIIRFHLFDHGPHMQLDLNSQMRWCLFRSTTDITKVTVARSANLRAWPRFCESIDISHMIAGLARAARQKRKQFVLRDRTV